MKSLFASLISAPAADSSPQEGLPYWTLWFLLCVILLLLTFIFLRDKNLRQRLNQFFFGAKKRLIKFRLHTRLKIARRKKADIHLSLGQKAWEKNLDVPGAEKTGRTIHKLEEKKQTLQQDLDATMQRLSALEKNLEDKSLKNSIRLTEKKAELKAKNENLSDVRNKLKEIRSSHSQKKRETEKVEKELDVLNQNLQGAEKQPKTEFSDAGQKTDKPGGNRKELTEQYLRIKQNIKELKQEINNQEDEEKKLKELIHDETAAFKDLEDECKKEREEIKKEIQEWTKFKTKIQQKILRIEKRKLPLFGSLGGFADQSRAEHESLVVFYSRIDRLNKKIEDIERQLEELG